MIYELNTDEFYAYGCLYEDWASINTEILLKEDVDGSILNKALNITFERMPYFKVKIDIAKNPERYILSTNEVEFNVIHSEQYIPLDSEQARNYLITISYFGKYIRIRFSHALSDGMGMNKFLSYMLKTYFNLKYEVKENTNNTISDIDLEYNNPFDYVENNGHCLKENRFDSFSFSKDDVSSEYTILSCISVPEEAFLKYSKESESSVATVAAWILMNAILDVEGDKALPLCVDLPFNMRNVLNCKDNMRNCNIDIELCMTKRLREHDNAFELSCLRGQMFKETFDACCIPKMNRSKKRWQDSLSIDGIDKKCDFYNSGDGLSANPIVTYVGKLDLKDYESYYEHIYQYLKVSGEAGVLIFTLCEKGLFRFCITSSLVKWNEYLKAFTDFLEKIDIPYTIDLNGKYI